VRPLPCGVNSMTRNAVRGMGGGVAHEETKASKRPPEGGHGFWAVRRATHAGVVKASPLRAIVRPFRRRSAHKGGNVDPGFDAPCSRAH